MHRFVLLETCLFTSAARISCNDPFPFKSLKTRNPKTCTLRVANLEDPDKMSHDAAFYQSLHCLLRINRSSEIEIHFF